MKGGAGGAEITPRLDPGRETQTWVVRLGNGLAEAMELVNEITWNG